MRDLGFGLRGWASIDSQAYKISHVSCPEYEVTVKFGYARHSKILSMQEFTADKELWLLVKGALIHTILKETQKKNGEFNTT